MDSMRKPDNHTGPLGNSESVSTDNLKSDRQSSTGTDDDSTTSDIVTPSASSTAAIIADSPSPPDTSTSPLSSSNEKMIRFLTETAAIKTGPKTKAIKFPVKLLYVLECGEYEDIITWTPNGISFIIADTKQFEDRVLPEVFKEAKFASFQRKLYRWAFTKHPRTEQSTYSHPNFQRGNFPLCMTMTCIKRAKGQQVQSSTSRPLGFPPQGSMIDRMLSGGMNHLSPAISVSSQFYDQQQAPLLLNSLSVPQRSVQMMPIQQIIPPSYQDLRGYDSINPYMNQGNQPQLTMDPSMMPMYYNGASSNSSVNDELMQLRLRTMMQGSQNQFSHDLTIAEQIQANQQHMLHNREHQQEQEYLNTMTHHLNRQRQQGEGSFASAAAAPNQSSIHDAARIMRDFNEQKD